MGLLLKAHVHDVGSLDRDSAPLLLEKLAGSFPRLQRVWADIGLSWSRCRVDQSADGLEGGDSQAPVEVGPLPLDVEPEPMPKRTTLPRQRVVERTFARLGRYQRMSKDYEYLTEMSEALIYAVMVRLMLRRLSRTAAETGEEGFSDTL